jgi:hypothetical protein
MGMVAASGGLQSVIWCEFYSGKIEAGKQARRKGRYELGRLRRLIGIGAAVTLQTRESERFEIGCGKRDG